MFYIPTDLATNVMKLCFAATIRQHRVYEIRPSCIIAGKGDLCMSINQSIMHEFHNDANRLLGRLQGHCHVVAMFIFVRRRTIFGTVPS